MKTGRVAMMKVCSGLMIFLLSLAGISCSVISKDIRAQSEPTVPYEQLLDQVDVYIGKTVILGGYIIDIQNFDQLTILNVLQTPLQWGDEPRSKDISQGRFTVSHPAFLDPEVYAKGRKITVAGKVQGTTVETVGETEQRYLQLESLQIHLWSQYSYYYPYHFDLYWSHPIFFHSYHFGPYYHHRPHRIPEQR